MSGQTTGWVLRQGPAPAMADRNGKPYGVRARGLRAVLLTIADAANRDGEHSHPGLSAMIEGSLYSKRQVMALTGELEAEGWVEITEPGIGRGHATVYRVCTEREKVQPPHPSAEAKGAVSEQERCSPDAEKVQFGDPAPLTLNVSNGNNDAALGWEPPAVVSAGGFLPAAKELAQLMAQQLADRGHATKGKGTSKRWVLEMEALLRVDGRTEAEVSWVLGWLSVGGDDVASFWRSVVLSPSNLRSKWGRMAEQYERQERGKAKPRRPLSSEGRAALARQYADRADPRSETGSRLPSKHAGGPR